MFVFCLIFEHWCCDTRLTEIMDHYNCYNVPRDKKSAFLTFSEYLMCFSKCWTRDKRSISCKERQCCCCFKLNKSCFSGAMKYIVNNTNWWTTIDKGKHLNHCQCRSWPTAGNVNQAGNTEIQSSTTKGRFPFIPLAEQLKEYGLKPSQELQTHVDCLGKRQCPF